MKDERTVFESAAGSVRRWIVWRRAIERARRTALPTFTLAAIVFLALAIFASWQAPVWVGAVLVAVWITALGCWSFYHRPSAYQALAAWDEHARRGELFASAYWFSQQPVAEVGERLHIRRASSRLAGELPHIHSQMPAPLARRVWAAPAAFLLALIAAGYLPQGDVEESLDVASRARAAEAGAKLHEKAKMIDPLKGLTPKEREKVEKLRASIKKTGDALTKLQKETPRHALGQLEARAREAEMLAEAMGADDDQFLSPQMIAELERHADTAELAAALRAQDASKSAQEADKLGKKLEDKTTSRDERKRIEEAFKKSLAAARPADKKRLVRKHLDKSHKHLRNQQPKLAGKQLQKLAKLLANNAQRQQSRKQLQQLASSLRSAGQQILGRSASGLQQLAQSSAGAGGLQRAGSQLSPITLMPGQRSGSQSGQRGSLSNGSGQTGQRMAVAAGQQSGSGQQGSGMTPVPGSASGSQSAMQLASMSAGGSMPGAGQIPVPGTCPNGTCPGGACAGGNCPGGAAGNNPGGAGGAGQSGSASASQGAGRGGHQAGSGSAPMSNMTTNPLAALKRGIVNAQASNQGPSSVTAIGPGDQREQAAREARELAISFLKVQEAALAEESLPLARQEQVLRYFTALRRQLVESTTQRP